MQQAQFNSLDPYLPQFRNINWIINRGGNLNELTYVDTGEPIYYDQNRFAQLQIPLTTGPIRIYFPFEGGNYIGFEYPPGLSAFQILGAINTYYNIPVPEEQLRYHRRNPQVIRKIRNGEIPTFRDIMGQLIFFGGLYKYKDGYTIDIGIRAETPNINF